MLTVHRVSSHRRGAHEAGVRGAMGYLSAAVPVVRRLLEREQYDVVHFVFSLPTAAMLPLLDLHGAPMIVSLRGSDVPGYDVELRGVQRAHLLLHPLTRWIWHRADRVVVPSESLGRLAQRTDPRLRYSVVQNGVDLGRFRPRVALRRVPDGVTRCLAVARLVERNGVDDLIDALALLDRNRYQLEIVGTGPHEGALRERVRRLGLERQVRFTGWLDRTQVARRYRESDLFTLVPRVESFGNSFLEALASGLPIVGSQVGGIPELVEHAPKRHAGDARGARASWRTRSPTSPPTRGSAPRSGGGTGARRSRSTPGTGPPPATCRSTTAPRATPLPTARWRSCPRAAGEPARGVAVGRIARAALRARPEPRRPGAGAGASPGHRLRVRRGGSGLSRPTSPTSAWGPGAGTSWRRRASGRRAGRPRALGPPGREAPTRCASWRTCSGGTA